VKTRLWLLSVNAALVFAVLGGLSRNWGTWVDGSGW
jgi:hypothetical protein